MKNGDKIDNKYIIIDYLGKGYTSIIELVKECDLDNNLYIAKLFVNEEHNSNYILNEIKINKLITEKNIPNSIKYINDGFLEEKNEYYLILEYAPKGDLLKYIYFTNEGFKEIYSKIIFLEILKGVKACHDIKISHRDLKCNNIVLDNDFNPKLCDFGCSMHFEENEDTRTRQRAGTRSHWAPQIFIEGKYHDTFKDDIFSLGVLLFNLVAADFGFELSNDSDTNYKKIKYCNFEQYWKDMEIEKKILNLSPEFKKFFVKLVSYKENDRPTVEEMLNDDWFKEIKDKNSSQMEELKKELKEEFLKREKICDKALRSELEAQKRIIESNTYRDNGFIKKEFFNSNMIPRLIDLKSIKYMNNYIKIKGNLVPDLFMNLLANKIISEQENILIKESKEFLKIDIIYEQEDEEEKEVEEKEEEEKEKEEEKDKEKEDEIDTFDSLNQELIIEVELFKFDKEECYLRFSKKSGDLLKYYQNLDKIIKITKKCI